MSNAAEKLVDAVIETYFQPLDKPLPREMRFLFTWLGAMTLFGSMLVLRAGPGILLEPLRSESVDLSIKTLIVILVAVVVPSLPALLIVSAETRHGPVRLYISGLLFSAFIVGVVFGTWAIEPQPEPAPAVIAIPPGVGPHQHPMYLSLSQP